MSRRPDDPDVLDVRPARGFGFSLCAGASAPLRRWRCCGLSESTLGRGPVSKRPKAPWERRPPVLFCSRFLFVLRFVVRLRVFRYSGHSGGLPCSRGKTPSPHGSAINGFLGRGNHPGYGILGTRVDERVHGVVTFGGGLPLCPEWRIPRSRATFFSIPLLAGTLRGGGGLGSRCLPHVGCPTLSAPRCVSGDPRRTRT